MGSPQPVESASQWADLQRRSGDQVHDAAGDAGEHSGAAVTWNADIGGGGGASRFSDLHTMLQEMETLLNTKGMPGLLSVTSSVPHLAAPTDGALLQRTSGSPGGLVESVAAALGLEEQQQQQQQHNLVPVRSSTAPQAARRGKHSVASGSGQRAVPEAAPVLQRTASGLRGGKVGVKQAGGGAGVVGNSQTPSKPAPGSLSPQAAVPAQASPVRPAAGLLHVPASGTMNMLKGSVKKHDSVHGEIDGCDSEPLDWRVPASPPPPPPARALRAAASLQHTAMRGRVSSRLAGSERRS